MNAAGHWFDLSWIWTYNFSISWERYVLHGTKSALTSGNLMIEWCPPYSLLKISQIIKLNPKALLNKQTMLDSNYYPQIFLFFFTAFSLFFCLMFIHLCFIYAKAIISKKSSAPIDDSQVRWAYLIQGNTSVGSNVSLFSLAY